ncbi:hypothetical protein LG329_05620 [Virgibacillus necropolis]|uniref:hypothetical protein n=1 Tax=Virgibacillus necropolis TaxID=163877 RepID=UPI00384A492E
MCHIVQHEAYDQALLYENNEENLIDEPIKMQKETIFLRITSLCLASITNLIQSY